MGDAGGVLLMSGGVLGAGLFWGWLFLGESPGWLALAGGLIIIASVAARTLQQRRVKDGGAGH